MAAAASARLKPIPLTLPLWWSFLYNSSLTFIIYFENMNANLFLSNSWLKIQHYMCTEGCAGYIVMLRLQLAFAELNHSGLSSPFFICFLLSCSESLFNQWIEPIPLLPQISTSCTCRDQFSIVTGYSVYNISAWEATEQISPPVNNQAWFVWDSSLPYHPDHWSERSLLPHVNFRKLNIYMRYLHPYISI